MIKQLVPFFTLLLLLMISSCRKKCDESNSSKHITPLTSANYTWFNFPEGTRLAYENNLGEKDTAVFGPVVTGQQMGHTYDDDGCYTSVDITLNQDIRWLHRLKGRIRPVKLVGYSSTRDAISIEYSNDSINNSSLYYNTELNDTATYNGKLYADVDLGCCAGPPSRFYDYALSKTAFYLKISFLLPDKSIETWLRK